MNRVRLALHVLFRRPKPTGPMRFSTRRAPDGVFLNLEEYFEHVITTLADDADAYALFQEVVDDRAESRGHDGWEPEQLLMERLAVAVGYEIPVRGEALTRLADRLKAVDWVVHGPAIPGQREGGAAA